MRHKLAVKKPLQVPRCSTFLKTDTRVLLWFVLANTKGPVINFAVKSDSTSPMYNFRFNGITLRLWRDAKNRPFLGHLQGSSRGCLRRLTKEECRTILFDGNQPFYKGFVTVRNFPLVFPPWQTDHERGGWIALVGLGTSSHFHYT
jgi:hypothetical protein